MLPKPNEPRLKLIPTVIMLLCSVTSKEQRRRSCRGARRVDLELKYRWSVRCAEERCIAPPFQRSYCLV